MVFASLSFIFLLLPFFLALDYGARRSGSAVLRNSVMLGVSLLFYVWGEAASVFLLLGLGIFNYAAGMWVHRSARPALWMALFVGVNLSVLIGFKYVWWLLSFLMPTLAGHKASMPLGISFFTFHAISYLIDIARRQIRPARTALDFLTYFCMFPHLVAGPIVRYAHVQDDLGPRGPDGALFAFGMYRFLLGLNKKVIIANSVAVLADSAFSLSGLGALHFADAWLGVLAYGVQIYFDFSGYSDMAIGLAAMAGFRFEENFQRPYSSSSIREFWRRWHISLSSWLRDYLYIPLGGSKHGSGITYRNLLIVFFLCGLWHGANVTFVVWGLWHGMFLVLERLPVGRMVERQMERLPARALAAGLARCYTLLVVSVGWVFFRAENIEAAWAYLRELFAVSGAPAALTYHSTGLVALAVGMGLCLLPDRLFPAPTSRSPGGFSMRAYAVQALLGGLSVALLLTGARNPFIYFDF